MSIIDHFPVGYKPTELQAQILPKLEAAINKKKKYIIFSAPTGFGKSFVPHTLANMAPECTSRYRELCMSYDVFKRDDMGAFKHAEECNAMPYFGGMVLTVSKPLQDQYISQFKRSCSVLKGKNNYTCHIDDRCSADVAPCVLHRSTRNDCWKKNHCAYYKARNFASCAKFSTLNYAMYFHMPDHVKRRKFLVCDEASELENELVNNFSITVNYKKLARLGIKEVKKVPVKPENRRAWLTDISVKLNDEIEDIKEKLSNDINDKKKQDTLIRFSQLQTLHSDISSVLELWSNVEFIFETVDVKGEEVVTITPLHVDHIAHKLFDHAEHVILMSATIIDAANFAKRLGITDYEVIEAPSPFDPKKSPIYFNTSFSINYKNLDMLVPKIADMINKICEEHKDEKGIIHTHSLALTNKIAEYLHGDRFLVRSDDFANIDILTQHFESDEPTVIVAPGLTHGTDLKDEYARFQIIIKAPYAPLTNERIKRLFEMDKQWYTNQMLSTFIQASGRGTRGVDDYCTAYVLDGSLARAVQMNSHILPKHFIKRII